jgi:DNA-binding CsgD family transcriptional regulator
LPDSALDDVRWLARVDQRIIAIPARGLVVGRAVDAGLRLHGGLVSREHARFHVVEGSLFVEDLASRNGVVVNHVKIRQPTRLAHGDTVRIGAETIEIQDSLVVRRPASLSTIPPPEVGLAPAGLSDVDGPEQTTIAEALGHLSEREREVLELLVLGHTQGEIAKQLHVSVKTVESHRAHIAGKLECHTRAEMVSFAISAGIFEDLRRRAIASSQNPQDKIRGTPQ